MAALRRENPESKSRSLLFTWSVLVTGTAVLLGAFGAYSQTRPPDTSESALQQAYAEHTKKVESMLPPHSGPPPFVELSKDANGGPARPDWVRRWDGIMGVRPHVDPGVPALWQATSTATINTELVGPIWTLPAGNSDAVAIATPLSASAHLSRDLRFVYSTFPLKLSKVLKGKSSAGFSSGRQILAAQFGGTVRYPSGHEATFLMANEGFIEPGKQFLLFLSKPIRSEDLYVVLDAYLIENGCVFVVSSLTGERPYDGTPIQEFEKRVKSLIAENANSE